METTTKTQKKTEPTPVVATEEKKARYQTPGITREIPMMDSKLSTSMQSTFNGNDGKGGINYNLYYIFVIAPNLRINSKLVKKASDDLSAGIKVIHGMINQLIDQKKIELAHRKITIPTKSDANRVKLTFHTPIAKQVLNVFESANELTELYTLLWADEAFDAVVYENHKREVRKLLHQILKGVENTSLLVRRAVAEAHVVPEQSVSELVEEQKAAERAKATQEAPSEATAAGEVANVQ
jgi:hypothetical protein